MDLKGKMIHAVTQYDIKQSSKRGYNRYALAQYMQAIDCVFSDFTKGSRLNEAIEEYFNEPLASILKKTAQ